MTRATLIAATALAVAGCGSKGGGSPPPEVHLAQRTLTATGGLFSVSGLLPDWEAAGDTTLVVKPKGGGLPLAELALRVWLAKGGSPDASTATDRDAAVTATQLFDGTRLLPADHLALAQDLVEIAPGAKAFAVGWDGKDDAGIAATVYVSHPSKPASGPELYGFKCELVLHRKGELDYRDGWRELAKECAALVVH